MKNNENIKSVAYNKKEKDQSLAMKINTEEKLKDYEDLKKIIQLPNAAMESIRDYLPTKNQDRAMIEDVQNDY